MPYIFLAGYGICYITTHMTDGLEHFPETD
jgi:hypothetical protein